jgi:hypothetical protein
VFIEKWNIKMTEKRGWFNKGLGFIVGGAVWCGCLLGAANGVPPAFAADVKVIEFERGRGWMLSVDKKPFYIHGVGCGLSRGKKGEDYLLMAKEVGANSVRTWGVDQGNQEYLDSAWSKGLHVDAGIWINWAESEKGISYLNKNAYVDGKRAEALAYIQRFKDHPAILMWNVGNEAIYFSKSEGEKIALARFLETLIQDIHRIDPNHPVVYTSAGNFDFPYLEKYVPSLDIVGSNVYGTVRSTQSYMESHGFDKPYLITEFGPRLPSDMNRDVNHMPEELEDYQKATIYKSFIEQIESFEGDNLGGYVFQLGESTQESMTWWNINEGLLKRQSYWAVYEAYHHKKAPTFAPKLRRMILSKQKDIKPGEEISVQVELKDGNKAGLEYNYRLSTSSFNVLLYYVNDYVDAQVAGTGPQVKVRAPMKEGVYRVYVFVSDGNGNASSLNKTIEVKNSSLKT